MSIEGRETDAYAERRRRENEHMAELRAKIGSNRARLAHAALTAPQDEPERRALVEACQLALPRMSSPVLRQVAALVGVTPPPWPQSEDAGQPWPGVDSGAEGGL